METSLTDVVFVDLYDTSPQFVRELLFVCRSWLYLDYPVDREFHTLLRVHATSLTLSAIVVVLTQVHNARNFNKCR